MSLLLERLSRSLEGKGRSVVLAGRPGIGKTELLKQLFGRLFWKQEEIVPFLYSVKSAILAPADFSRDYLVRYLCQCLAFQSREQMFLQPEGMPIEELSMVIEQRGAVWARELLDRYDRCAAEPLSALALAINAPRHAALAAGITSVIMIDDFHRLAGLPAAAFFEDTLSFGRTPHILCGNQAAIDEMAVAGRLDRHVLPPLGPDDVVSMVRSLRGAYDNGEDLPPPPMVVRIAGNPLYVSSIIGRAYSTQRLQDEDYWRAYAAEIAEGALYRFWTGRLKEFFPDMAMRVVALRLAYTVCRAADAMPCSRIARAMATSEGTAERVAHQLYLAGFIRGEFGLFRRIEDRIMMDVVEYLHGREVEGNSPAELERKLLEPSRERHDDTVRFEMVLPMAHEVELIAAKCIEQIGTNLHVDGDAVGQMQIAVIEACINAIEHTNGSDRNLYLIVTVGSDRLEVSVESSGREFVMLETGEPVGGKSKKTSEAGGRGWGIKLMKRFVDEVRFEKTKRGTKTVLTKKIAAKADIQKEKIGE
jgi:serine/threonine-protein kinase RsbW